MKTGKRDVLTATRFFLFCALFAVTAVHLTAVAAYAQPAGGGASMADESADPYLFDPMAPLSPMPPASDTVRFPRLKPIYDELLALRTEVDENRKEFQGFIDGCLKGGKAPIPESQEQFSEFMDNLPVTEINSDDLTNYIPYYVTCEAIKQRNVNYCDSTPFVMLRDMHDRNPSEQAEGMCPAFYVIWRMIAIVAGREDPMEEREIKTLCAQGLEDPFQATKSQCMETFTAFSSYAFDGDPGVCDKFGIDVLKPFCKALITGDAGFCNGFPNLKYKSMPMQCRVFLDVKNALTSDDKDENLMDTLNKKYASEAESLCDDCYEPPIMFYPMLIANIDTLTGRPEECFYTFYLPHKELYCKYFMRTYMDEKVAALVLRYEDRIKHFEGQRRIEEYLEAIEKESEANKEAGGETEVRDPDDAGADPESRIKDGDSEDGDSEDGDSEDGDSEDGDSEDGDSEVDDSEDGDSEGDAPENNDETE